MKQEISLFTSESVSEGHPDKLADQISDSILDAFLAEDPNSRVACEVMIPSKTVVVGGEITSKAKVDIPDVVRKIIKKVGYDKEEKGLDYKTCSLLLAINSQSQDIANGIKAKEKKKKTLKAGDQGLMFGYATNETKVYMPLSLILAHQLVRELAQFRKREKLPFLWPDSKSQITIEYEGAQPKRLHTLVLSTQHSPDISQKKLCEFIQFEFLKQVSPPLKNWLEKQTKILINPTGRFVIGGPQADCGLTGRKIIMDTYGGRGAHGGGCFSGKDPSKIDRSAAYATRHIAKNLVAAGVMSQCLIQIAYVIGRSEPVSFMIEDYGTSSLEKAKILKAVQEIWNLEPSNIISFFDLLKPRYTKTASYGHFGRNEKGFTWEKLDKVDELKKALF